MLLWQRGCQALFPEVAPTGSVRERAEQLKRQILTWTDGPVNLVAHSMGGLDARYLITHLGMAPRVASLTTIATPHQGTYLADWFCTIFGRRLPLFKLFEALGVTTEGYRSCRRADCREFNARTPNMPGVRYFSYAAALPHAPSGPVLRMTWRILRRVEGPNDGMVSVASARWGEFLGVIPTDHFTQTLETPFLHPAQDFDALGLWARLVEDLAHRGL
jgi:triacylglycerol lipase